MSVGKQCSSSCSDSNYICDEHNNNCTVEKRSCSSETGSSDGSSDSSEEDDDASVVSDDDEATPDTEAFHELIFVRAYVKDSHGKWVDKTDDLSVQSFEKIDVTRNDVTTTYTVHSAAVFKWNGEEAEDAFGIITKIRRNEDPTYFDFFYKFLYNTKEAQSNDVREFDANRRMKTSGQLSRISDVLRSWKRRGIGWQAPRDAILDPLDLIFVPLEEHSTEVEALRYPIRIYSRRKDVPKHLQNSKRDFLVRFAFCAQTNVDFSSTAEIDKKQYLELTKMNLFWKDELQPLYTRS